MSAAASMSGTPASHPFPRLPLLGAAVLIAAAVLLAALGRLGGLGAAPAALPQIVESRALHFEDRADGAVTIRDAQSGEIVEEVAPGSGGFLRGVLRSLVRERRALGIGRQTPFELARSAGGQLALTDPATGRSIVLDAFGPSNVGAFERLLAAPTLPSTSTGRNP